MRITIVNRFIPPDEAPTSVLAGELGEHLTRSGHDVQLISSSTNYRKGKSGGMHRIASELISHLVLLFKMLTAPKSDLLLCLSSPTCLAVTAAFAACLRRQRFAHWAMDVYPEIAVRLGEIREGSLVHRVTQKLMHWAYSRADVLVALDEDMQALFEKNGHDAAVCRPWTPLALKWPEADHSPVEQRPLRWVYSGNLGRAHEWEALLDAQKLLEIEAPGEFELIFQGGGANRLPAQTRARDLGLEQCTWTDYAAKEALLESLFKADVLVATQNPSTRGLLWPSKLAVMRHVPRPILWVGPGDSAVTGELANRPSTAPIASGPEAARSIATWLMGLRQSESPETAPRRTTALPSYSPPDPSSLRQPIADLEEILFS